MSTLKVTNIQDTSGGNSSTTEEIFEGRAKAWVNFNGMNTVSIRDSYNVSSITDNGTGDFTHKFTNNMSNDDFAFTTGTNGNSNEGVNSYNMYYDPDTVESSSVTSRNISSGGTAQDSYYIMGMVAGDLA